MTTRPRPPRDAGMSLAELLVAMTILSLIGGLVATVAMITLRTSSGIQARLDNTSQGELGIAAAGKVLRTAVLPRQLDEEACPTCEDTAILTASATEVTFYANVGDTSIGPSLVKLYVREDPDHLGTAVLRQDTRPAIPESDGTYTFCTSSGCAFQSRILARGLRWPSPGVLAYYDYEGELMSGSTVFGEGLARISSVDLVMTVQHRPGDGRYPARTAVTRVRLPNVEIDNPTDDD